MSSRDTVCVYCRGCGQKLDVSMLEPFTCAPCPECGTQVRIPRRFDRYLLEEVCGIGGTAKVYRAVDPALSRCVAVKILNQEITERELFIHEAKLIARINHPGIIPIYDCGVFGNEPFIVMRYMERGNLESMQKAELLPETPVLCNWLSDVAGGLHAALQYQVVHHDLKPGNILVSGDGDAGLGDFDMADIRENRSLLNPTEWISPAYVSPERLSEGHEDWAGDVFSLGVSAYELLTGQLPFGHSGDPSTLLERRRHPVYLPAEDLNASVSREISELIQRMMSFSPSERPRYPEIIDGFKRFSRRRRTGFFGRIGAFFRRTEAVTII